MRLERLNVTFTRNRGGVLKAPPPLPFGMNVTFMPLDGLNVTFKQYDGDGMGPGGIGHGAVSSASTSWAMRKASLAAGTPA